MLFVSHLKIEAEFFEAFVNKNGIIAAMINFSITRILATKESDTFELSKENGNNFGPTLLTALSVA